MRLRRGRGRLDVSFRDVAGDAACDTHNKERTIMLLKRSHLLPALCAAAVIAAPAGPALAQDIVLGASVQLTGPLANTGRYYRDAYQLAIDKINAAGGVKVGGKDYKLALKLYDNQSDVNLSVRQYTQLVSQDKVNLLLGPFASNFALADSAVSDHLMLSRPGIALDLPLRVVVWQEADGTVWLGYHDV